MERIPNSPPRHPLSDEPLTPAESRKELVKSVLELDELGAPRRDEESVFTIHPDSQLASLTGGARIFVHAETPEKSLVLAQEYGMQHPDTKVAFNNTEETNSPHGKTERIGVMEFNRYGHIKSFEPDIRSDILAVTGS